MLAVVIDGREAGDHGEEGPGVDEEQTGPLVPSEWRGPTAREREVLRLLGAGLTREQIARSTNQSLRTVVRIITRLEEKLDAPCPFVLGVKAARLGLV
jgi:DNA-binding NarL/FixJ family response regulator